MKRRPEPELPWSRRQFMQGAGLVAGAAWLAPAYAWSDAAVAAVKPEAVVPPTDGASAIDLNIDAFSLNVDGRSGKAIAVNGSVPGPLIRLREGQECSGYTTI